jgi:alkylhydroperoxidase/carboxymuconolactone decarboxylase family protein YurZ
MSDSDELPTDSGEAYIALPTVDEVGATRDADHPYNFGFVTGMARLLNAHPRIGPAFQSLYAAIMFAPGALSRQERELVAAVAASAQACFY